MTFEIVIGERVRKINITQRGPLLQVLLDGRPYQVDATRISDSELSLLLQGAGDPHPIRSVDAAFVSRNGNGELDVHVAGSAVPVLVREASSRPGPAVDKSGKAGGGPQRVTAPMPGKIVRVLVKPGEEVKARQGLVVVEAMKMENELRAARDGRVREVAVSEGQSVEAGAILAVVE